MYTETSRTFSPLSYFTVSVDGVSFSFQDDQELCQLLQNLPLYVKDIPAITGMSNTETQFQWFPLLYSNLVAFVHEQDSRKHRQNWTELWKYSYQVFLICKPFISRRIRQCWKRIGSFPFSFQFVQLIISEFPYIWWICIFHPQHSLKLLFCKPQIVQYFSEI